MGPRSLVAWFSLLGLLAAAGCGKDAGPFGDLLARMPADAQLVISVDLAEALRTGRAWVDEVQLLPILQANKELKDLLQGQRDALDKLIAPVRDKLGVDPWKDLGLAVLGARFVDDAEPMAVVVVKGTFPPDLLKRAFPAAPVAPREGVQVATLEDGYEAAQLEGLVILAHRDLMAGALKPSDQARDGLRKAHPLHGEKVEPGFLLRASFVLPEWLRQKLMSEKAPGNVGLGLVTGLARFEIGLDREVLLRAVASDAGTAESYQHLMNALADGILGSQHAARALGFLVMTLDLDRLPEVPPAARLLLKDDSALATSLEVLLPPPAGVPEVRRDGLQVSLRSERKSWAVLGLVGAGLVGTFMVPAMMLGMALDDLEESLEKAAPPEPPPAPPAGGGAP